MTSLTTIRSALRLSGVLTLISFAACSDKSPTGMADTPLLSRGRNGAAQPAAAKVAEVKILAALVAPADAPFAGAKGKAKFVSKGTQSELEIEVEHIPAGTAVIFMYDGAQLGTGVANEFGEAELELSTKRGDTVPAVVAGKAVSVTTTAPAVIVAGTF